MSYQTDPASYRDPSGFIFYDKGQIYRQVNQVFRGDFDHFISSGAYADLSNRGLLVKHTQADQDITGGADWYATIKPTPVPFVSYPWEWSFQMLKDAALLTLDLAKRSLDFNCSLKDATPFNIQWLDGRLIFIDTLSFERYDETRPWIAYRQFCECFLSPLLLMHYARQPLQQLMLAYPEGIPLAVTRSLLPWRSRLNLNVYLHIYLQTNVQSRALVKSSHVKSTFNKTKLVNLLDSLRSLVERLQLPEQKSTWLNYYDEAETRADYLSVKKTLVASMLLPLTAVKTVIDLGANEGEFSMITAGTGRYTIAADIDPFCIDRLYGRLKSSKNPQVQPMIADLALPGPAIGVNNEERPAFSARCRTDLAMALALIHHLAIGRNIPFDTIAAFLVKLAPLLLIEFVPLDDEKVTGMLKSKSRDFNHYNEQNFVTSFGKLFDVKDRQPITGSGRVLFLMQRK